MKIHTGSNIKINTPTAIAIGKFDGLHKGHAALIKELTVSARRRNLSSAILSFSPHPAALFSNSPEAPLLLTQDEKYTMLEKMGIDDLIEYPFTKDFAELEPERFVKDVFAKQLCGRLMVVGSDFRFGKDRMGDAAFAKTIGKACNVSVLTISPITEESDKISSNAIRNSIIACDFAKAEKMLGYPYFVSDICPIGKLMPPAGAYFCRVYSNKQTFSIIVHVTETGLRPQANLDSNPLKVEFCIALS